MAIKYFYVRPTHDVSEEVQIEAGLAAGYKPERMWIEGRDGPLSEIIGKLRKGDTLGLFSAYMLATPRQQRSEQPRKSLRETIKLICGRQSFVHDVTTGLKSDDPEEKIQMIFDAIDELSRGGRKLAGRGSVGAPRKIEFETEADKDLALEMWNSTKYATREQAMEAIRKRFWPHVKSISQTTGYRLHTVPVKAKT